MERSVFVTGDKEKTMNNEGNIDLPTTPEHCRSGSFIDYDGDGLPVRDGMADRKWTLTPSVVRKFGRSAMPDDATHVIWFNR